MKILHPDLPGSTGVKSGKNARGTEGAKSKPSESGNHAGAAKKGDSVEISSAGYQMKGIEAKLKEIPDIRVEKVDEMKGRIANGYNPPAEDVADAIIRTVSIL